MAASSAASLAEAKACRGCAKFLCSHCTLTPESSRRVTCRKSQKY